MRGLNSPPSRRWTGLTAYQILPSYVANSSKERVSIAAPPSVLHVGSNPQAPDFNRAGVQADPLNDRTQSTIPETIARTGAAFQPNNCEEALAGKNEPSSINDIAKTLSRTFRILFALFIP